jgi:dihydrofolate reductase
MPRPLPKRINVLATSRPTDYNGADKYISGDLNLSVQRLAEEYPSLITWVIGGPNIIEQTLGVIDEFYISRIPGDFDCDTHLPLKKIEALFELTTVIHETGVTFEIWEKRKKYEAVS